MKKWYEKNPFVSDCEYANELSGYTDQNGNQAVIPPGWVVSGITEENTIWGKDQGLVIYRMPKEEVKEINWLDQEQVEKVKRTHDQLVWCPVEFLDADGTLDGNHFDSKFGRRNYRNVGFLDEEFKEELEGELLEQCKSIETYGGFYITRYNLSDGKTKPRSVKWAKPCTKIDFPTAMEIATKFESTEFVQSHLLYGAEYDSVMEWLIKSGSKTRREIVDDSTKWGNYWNSKVSRHKLVVTGRHEDWKSNNIYDLAGNNDEWTQERYGETCRAIRGGDFYRDGFRFPASIRGYCYPNSKNHGTSCRGACFIK